MDFISRIVDRRHFLGNSIKVATAAFISPSLLMSCTKAKFPFKKGARIGFFGDSTTFANKNGYVELLQRDFDEKMPDHKLVLINLGKNSETITGLTEKEHPGLRPYLFDRLDNDLDTHEPDVVFFCYGINCGIYNPPSADTFARYQKGVEGFLKAVAVRNIKAYLMTPPPLILDPKSSKQSTDYSWKQPYPWYEEEVLSVFRKILVETEHPNVQQKIMIHEPLIANAADAYGEDPIHPNQFGHQIIADTILDALHIVSKS